jgi:hypothetical protein
MLHDNVQSYIYKYQIKILLIVFTVAANQNGITSYWRYVISVQRQIGAKTNRRQDKSAQWPQ